MARLTAALILLVGAPRFELGTPSPPVPGVCITKANSSARFRCTKCRCCLFESPSVHYCYSPAVTVPNACGALPGVTAARLHGEEADGRERIAAAARRSSARDCRRRMSRPLLGGAAERSEIVG